LFAILGGKFGPVCGLLVFTVKTASPQKTVQLYYCQFLLNVNWFKVVTQKRDRCSKVVVIQMMESNSLKTGGR
jgi:hypothetical protein